MLRVEWNSDHGWGEPKISPYQNLSLAPSCSTFHYALEVSWKLEILSCMIYSQTCSYVKFELINSFMEYWFHSLICFNNPLLKWIMPIQTVTWSWQRGEFDKFLNLHTVSHEYNHHNDYISLLLSSLLSLPATNLKTPGVVFRHSEELKTCDW